MSCKGGQKSLGNGSHVYERRSKTGEKMFFRCCADIILKGAFALTESMQAPFQYNINLNFIFEQPPRC